MQAITADAPQPALPSRLWTGTRFSPSHCSPWQPSQSLPVHKHRSLPGTAIRLLKDMKDAPLTPALLLSPPHPSFQPSKLNSWVIKKKADMGGTGLFGFVFKTLPYLWGVYSGVAFSSPFLFLFWWLALCWGCSADLQQQNFHCAPSAVPKHFALKTH